MGTVEELHEYVVNATGGASWRAIAEATGIEPSTLTRQFHRERVSVQTVVAIARAYRADLLTGLVAGGFITREEAAGIANHGALRAASDLQLAEEILRRVRDAPSPDLESPLDADHPAYRTVLVDEPARDAENSAPGAGAGAVIEGRFEQLGSTRRFASDAAASVSDVSIYDEATAMEEQP